jgi:hypothetical protein
LRPTKTRTRRRSLPALAVLLIAGGCGGGNEAEPPPRPTIQRATAEQLAATSDSIADALDAGDVCSAAGRADDLRAQVIEAINAKKIPPRFQEDVLARAQELVNTVNCPPPPTTTADDEDEKEKKEEKDKKKPKQDDEQNGETVELPVEPPPTTESLP